tara:strand:- start:16714 stop:17091 length:378 start_codon:yes stop_codon:yes gene_type:complete
MTQTNPLIKNNLELEDLIVKPNSRDIKPVLRIANFNGLQRQVEEQIQCEIANKNSRIIDPKTRFLLPDITSFVNKREEPSCVLLYDVNMTNWNPYVSSTSGEYEITQYDCKDYDCKDYVSVYESR